MDSPWCSSEANIVVALWTRKATPSKTAISLIVSSVDSKLPATIYKRRYILRPIPTNKTLFALLVCVAICGVSCNFIQDKVRRLQVKCRVSTRHIYRSKSIYFTAVKISPLHAVITRNTFTRGKLTFLLYCVKFSIVKWHLPHVNVSRVNTAKDTIWNVGKCSSEQ